jgi:hypothetical protein
MSGERRAIESPLWVDFTGRPVPPLRFLLQREYSPAGIVEPRSDGITASHSPWYSEFVLQMTGIDAVSVLYLMSKDDDTALLMACLDEFPEPFFELLSGADFGDGLTRLIAQHWPDLYGMLLASNKRTPGARILCNVATPGRVQWVVADQIPASTEGVATEQVMDLVGASLQTFARMTNVVSELPGVIDVLGGPDRMSRRLKAVSGLLGSAGDIGAVFQGGMTGNELLALAKSARSVVNDLIALKD